MWGHETHQQAYEQVYNDQSEPHHEAKWSHELVAGAASFYAMRKYEEHQAANGAPPSHQFVKEMLAGIAGAEVDKLAETKGMDAMSRHRAKQQAQQEAVQMYENSGYRSEYDQQGIPQQHDGYQQGQGYQAYQQGGVGMGGGYGNQGMNQGVDGAYGNQGMGQMGGQMGMGGGYNQGMGGGMGDGYDQGMGNQQMMQGGGHHHRHHNG